MTQKYFGREIAGVTYGANLKGRMREQREHIARLRETGEKKEYTTTRGDYSDGEHELLAAQSLWTGGPAFERHFERHSVEELIGLEKYFADLIERLLEIKNGQEPVVAMDIGGMFGLSWLRLAHHFATKVKTSEVAFVVSNLMPDEDDYAKNFTYTGDEIALARDTRPLLHMITGTTRLDRRQIKLPNNSVLPLEHAVDIIYEYFSVTSWSKVPDLDILKMVKLLSPYGMYFTEHDVNGIIRGERTAEEKTERRAAIEMARQQLVDYGLARRTQVEAGKMKGKQLRYDVFKGTLAPLISLD